MSELEEPFGLTLLVDKPLEWTSFDVVNKLRYAAKRATGRKKIKVGHAGTLDPLATGLLIICVGSHTKTIEQWMGMDKRYEGTILLGSTTPSYDLETEVNEIFEIPELDEVKFKGVASQFLGFSNQIPPIFSAKKIDGKKAYELARKGKEVTMKSSQIRIESLDLTFKKYPEIEFDLRCSKGTYVRSLAFDIGQKLNTGGHLIRLRRTEIGESLVSNALGVEEAMKHIESEYLNYLNRVSI
jgi:tRNA pseudouridine55 synthase